LEVPHHDLPQSVAPNPQIREVLPTRANPQGRDCASWRPPMKIHTIREVTGIAFAGGNAKTAKLQDRRSGQHMCNWRFEFTDYNDALPDH
jgi:hypothetical protein